jgi:hypothetical protein
MRPGSFKSHGQALFTMRAVLSGSADSFSITREPAGCSETVRRAGWLQSRHRGVRIAPLIADLDPAQSPTVWRHHSLPDQIASTIVVTVAAIAVRITVAIGVAVGSIGSRSG